MENVKNAKYAGFGALDGGINTQPNHSISSLTNPNGLLYNQLARAVNCTMRGGAGVTHRPPLVQRVLQFPDADVLGAFGPQSLYQGAHVHQADESSILVSISGRFYQIKPAEHFRVIDLTLSGDADASIINFSWWVQAGPFTVKQDGLSRPLIFDGSKLRRAKGDELLVGQAMAYSQGRIWYATYDQFTRVTRFRATDLIGSRLSGTAAYDYDDSVLKETENTFLNEGGDFTARSDMGEIRAMVVPRMPDTSLGQGPLQILCERGIMSVNAPVDRTTWKDVTYPILTESQFDYGTLGARAAINFNGDIIYRSVEGFHSWQLARQDFKTWLNTPISREVDEFIEGDPEPLLFFNSGVNFDSRFVSSCLPRNSVSGVQHDGLVALDMDLVSTLRRRESNMPAWEGLWTGLAFLQIFKGTFGNVERCFAFARNPSNGMIELWELLPTATDIIWDNERTPIVWSFETPAYDYGTPQDLKRLVTAAFWVDDLQETVTYTASWRPDQHPCYTPWHTWQQCGPVRQCAADLAAQVDPVTKLPVACPTIQNRRPQYRPKFKLPVPPDTCDPVNNIYFRDAFEHQLRVQVTGHVRIRKIRLAAVPQTEPFLDGCPTVEPCNPLICCAPDPLVYSAAPFHTSGSTPVPPTPPIVYNPPPPIDYYPTPPCDSCGTTNPPGVNEPPQGGPPFPAPEPTPGRDRPPVTVDLPGIPSGTPLLPNPDATELVGDHFRGEWSRPSDGTTLEAGWMIQPPEGLPDGVYEAWAQSMWEQFSAFVGANSLNIAAAQIQNAFTGDDIGPGAERRWFANAVFPTFTDTTSSFGLGHVLVIVYTTS